MKPFLYAPLALALMAGVSVAQTGNEIDISNFTEPVLQALLILLAGVASWAFTAARAWLATKTERANSEIIDAIQKRYNEAIARSMAYAETTLKTHIDLADGKTVVNNEFIRESAEYLKTHWPDLTKDMHLDGIAKSIVARLPSGPLSENAEIVAQTNAATQ